MYYAVKIGLIPGVYTSWDECKNLVLGYPNSKYKKFKTEKEAYEYLQIDPAISIEQKEEDSQVNLFDLKEEPTQANETLEEFDIIHIYTDGACSGNPGPGGWSTVIIDEYGMITYSSGGKARTTNNEMELTAIIEGLSKIKSKQKIILYSDSMYAINCLSKWIHNWEKNNWIKSDGSPVLNKELIMKAKKLVDFHKEVKFVHVKGHAGNQYNEMCDELAVKESQKFR